MSTRDAQSFRSKCTFAGNTCTDDALGILGTNSCSGNRRSSPRIPLRVIEPRGGGAAAPRNGFNLRQGQDFLGEACAQAGDERTPASNQDVLDKGCPTISRTPV